MVDVCDWIELRKHGLLSDPAQGLFTLEDERHDTSEGVAQGSVLSPLLANVYLHYVLDECVSFKVTFSTSMSMTIGQGENIVTAQGEIRGKP